MNQSHEQTGLVCLDDAQKVWYDAAEQVLVVDGVRVFMESLIGIVNPDRTKYFRAQRDGDNVTVTSYTRGAMMAELGFQRSELDALAHEIAYADSCVAIESNCLSSFEDRNLFDAEAVDELAKEHVGRAIRYLDMRGLIERDQAWPGCISIRDESEATA